MTKRIFRSIIFVAAVILISCLFVVTAVIYDYFTDFHENQLDAELELAAAGVEQNGINYLYDISPQSHRITLIASDGTVLHDTRVDAASMENHADREEVREAIEDGSGESSRYSGTLTEQTLYSAVLLSDGSVLRISVSRDTALALVTDMLQPIVIVALLAIILSFIWARRLSKRIVKPLNSLDLDHPLENNAYDELAPLLSRINQQHMQIAQQMYRLRQKTDEFEQITSSMNEGLVLLDSKETVISINPAAKRIFSADAACVGRDFLTVDRSSDMRLCIKKAMKDGHSEMRAERDGREYQFDISRIQSQGTAHGAVILAFDVTEQAFAERNRREFTANVSHELKTPLQGIIGSADLIEHNMVKTEDIPRFIGHIRAEAARMVTLIDDIIRLSQLDEGSEMPAEKVELLSLAGETAESLDMAAKAKNITMSVSGTPVTISGVRRLIYEIIYNLCDNAIKYNVDGGTVDVTVSETDTEAVVTVKDTGIGIGKEHQPRIFERFYRVDKSHSKASGGTGLGLSIVKHAVRYHDAKLELKSTPGEGTTITVRFKK